MTYRAFFVWMTTALVALVLPACVSEQVKDTAATVLTLQSGTVSALRAQRGTGPFRAYGVAPDVLLGVVEEAAHKARGQGGEPVRAIFLSASRGEVLAKERAADEAADDGYAAPFRTAMLAIVHPVSGAPGRSRLEIHEISRGPFHGGVVRWTKDMPGWIDAVLADRARAEAQPIRPIP